MFTVSDERSSFDAHTDQIIEIFRNTMMFRKNIVCTSKLKFSEAQSCFETTDLLYNNSNDSNQITISEKASFYIRTIPFRNVIFVGKTV